MKISKTLKAFGLTLIPTFGIILALVLVIPFGISQIKTLLNKISQEKMSQDVLAQKLDLLTNVRDNDVYQTNVLAVAIPDSNPALLSLFQMKNLAGRNGLIISDVKGSGETKDKTGLSRTDISFDLSGSRAQIFSFLSEVSNVSPITVVVKFKMNESGESVLANVTVRSFWASFPTKLPVVDEPENDLTNDEKNLLTKVSSLIQPSFFEVPAESESSGRSDPFNP